MNPALHRARRLLSIALIAIGVVLTVAVGWSLSTVYDTAQTAARGQGEALLHVAFRQSMGPDDPRSALEAVYSAHAAEGLRCVALYDDQMARQAIAGPCPTLGDATDDQLLELAPMRPFEVGDGVWMIMHQSERHRVRRRRAASGPPARPPDPRGHQALMSGAAAGGRPHRRPGGRHRPPIVIEFVPLEAQALVQSATGATVAGALAALALIAAALWMARMSRREEALQAARTRERHLASLGEMSATLAHEIRNPLASLKGHAQLLVEYLPERPKLQGKAQRVVDEAVRLERLCNDLLGLVRERRLDLQPHDPVALIAEAAEAVACQCAVDGEGAPPRWSLDPPRLRQVLINVLRNAHQASPDEVEATVRADGGQLVVAVRDHGAGIDADAFERIFEPFVTTRVRGTGLGLAVSRRIVELHGGTIVAENHPGGGAVFTIRLPAARGDG